MNNPKDQALKTLAKGAAFVYIGMIFSKVFTYLYRIIIARIGTSEYGLLSLGLAVVNLLMHIPLLGMNEGIVRYVSFYLGLKDKQRVKGTITTALKISAPLSLIFTAILFFNSEYIAINILREPRLNLVIKILSTVIPFYVLGALYLSVIKAHQRMDYWVSIKNIFENLMKVFITYILITMGFGVIGAAIGFTISGIITFFIALIIVEFKLVPIIKSKIKSIKPTKKLLLYSWPIMFNIILGQILGWTDTIMIGFFRNVSEVGIYNAAHPTAQIITIVPAGIMALFIPVMTNLYAQKKKQELVMIYKTSTKWTYYLILYLLSIFILFSKYILYILFGKAYIVGSSTLIIISIGFFIYSFLGATDVMLKVINKTKLLMINTIFSTTLNIILNYKLIPIYGMVGGAIASTIAISIWSTLAFIESYYLTKIHPFKKDFIKLTVVGLINFFIIYLIQDYFKFGISRLILGSFLLLISYIALIIIFQCLDKEDIRIIIAIKKKIQQYI